MLERLVLPPWLRFSLALPLLVLNLWVLRQLLLPLAPFPALFVTAALLAFLLDIPCRWLVERGLPRPLALALVLGVGFGGVALVTIWLLPRLVQQLDELITTLPGWLAEGEVLLGRLQGWAVERGLPSDFGDLSSELITRTSKIATQLSQRLLGLLGATVGLTVNVVIVLVLSVFLLVGGERIAAGLAAWLPPGVRGLVTGTLDRTFRGYFGGQVLLALILSGLQNVLYLLYIVFAVLILVRYRDLVVRLGGPVFLGAVLLLGTSLLFDKFQEALPIAYGPGQLFEEGVKFLGIASWLFFWWRAAAGASSGCHRR
jgi:predicted PurR-regulated permease PerM